MTTSEETPAIPVFLRDLRGFYVAVTVGFEPVSSRP